ncbi:transcriptional regulator, AraC family [Myroides odoratimimus]|uniref:helix-turn-helix domain-containing protein n=1 Tax=Myroides odoratimimus TaxID=76832 RepID=UPI000727B8FF|nr:AraC family transcriptional regulator [Myroides odoratimimus]GAQ15686.1 transcriptional regulator, AraC family [Myroides odoratimimus]STZ49441.1 Methylphosphotriester-DNA--protein-cysteine S-methyltransferase [Myroides odoratimimus]
MTITVPRVFTELAKYLDIQIEKGRIDIPSDKGVGYCIGYYLNENIRILITDYKLNKEISINNPELLSENKIILFKFQGILSDSTLEGKVKDIPRVLIATSRINTEDTIVIDCDSSINIEIDANYLKNQLGREEHSPIIKGLLENNQPLLFEQLLYPDLSIILKEIMDSSVYESFELFYLKIKAEQIICSLLYQLEKRDNRYLYALNNHDIQTIYNIRDLILKDLTRAPQLKELVEISNMSLSKLQRLFKQVFGSTLFNYYQEFRIKEAARLLKEEKLSVSEVGYYLGFTNLSHFSQVFEKHIGVKPKKYTML